jgi:hypothetical protein
VVKHPFPLNLNQTGALVTIKNVSGTDILGPIQLVLAGLPKGVTVADIAGHTVTGDPFLTLPVNDLGPGQSVTLSLRFNDPFPVPLTYDLLVFSGPLPPALPPLHLDPTATAPTPAGGGLAASPLFLDSSFTAGPANTSPEGVS